MAQATASISSQTAISGAIDTATGSAIHTINGNSATDNAITITTDNIDEGNVNNYYTEQRSSIFLTQSIYTCIKYFFLLQLIYLHSELN